MQKNVDSIESDDKRLENFMENWGTFSQYPRAVSPFASVEIREDSGKRYKKLLDDHEVKFLK